MFVVNNILQVKRTPQDYINELTSHFISHLNPISCILGTTSGYNFPYCIFLIAFVEHLAGSILK